MEVGGWEEGRPSRVRRRLSSLPPPRPPRPSPHPISLPPLPTQIASYLTSYLAELIPEMEYRREGTEGKGRNCRMETSDCILRRIPPNLRPKAVLCGSVLCMASLSVVYSFGNLLPYLVSYLHFRVDDSITAGSMIWMQTLLSGVPFSMVVGGVVEGAMGGRAATALGCFLYTGSIALSSIVVQFSYSWLLFSFGFLPSFASGVAYNAVLITAQRWWRGNIGLASGIVVGGFGCGTLFIAPLQTAFVNPNKYVPNADGLFTQADLLDRVPSVFAVMAVFFACLQLVGVMLLATPEESLLMEEDEDSSSLVGSTPLLNRRQLLCSWSFFFLFFTLLCNSTWVQISTGLYKAYGLKFIPSDHFLSLVAAVSSIFNCGSRVVWGYMADKSSYQLCMSIVSVAAGVILWSFPAVAMAESPWLFLVAVCAVFCCVGGTYSLLPFASSRLFGQENFGLMYGLIQLSLTLAGIISGLLGQFVLPTLGYERLFLLVGALPVVSFVFTALIHFTSLARSCAMSRNESFQT